jgi:hypothetical protein
MGLAGSDESGRGIGGHSMLCLYGNDLGGADRLRRAFEEVNGAGETNADGYMKRGQAVPFEEVKGAGETPALRTKRASLRFRVSAYQTTNRREAAC